MMTTIYTLRDDGGSTETIETTDLDDARAQAETWVRGGEWGDDGAHVHVRIEQDGEQIDSLTVSIAAREPRCDRGEHDWQRPIALVGGIDENPGVWGHGAGVIIHECCMHCWMRRRTDTGATTSTGERAPKISYEAKCYAHRDDE